MSTEYTEKINKKGNRVITLWSDADYTIKNYKLLRVEDNGNGFTIKSYSWTSTDPDMYYNLDYSTAAELLDVLTLFDFRDEPDEQQ